MDNERKRTNTAEKQSKEPGGSSERTARSDDKHERSSHWDIGDPKENGWVRKSPRSIEGRFTNRFFEED